VVIPSNVKHALRNSFFPPETLAVVTKSELYKFFFEIAKPFDPSQRSAAPTSQEIEEFVSIAGKYRYWMASPEENASIGLEVS